MAGGNTSLREILGTVRQAVRSSTLTAVNPDGLAQLLQMCDALDRASATRQGAYDRFEREAYLAAGEEVRQVAYRLATALGRLLPDQRQLAERLVASEAQPPGAH